MNHLSQQQIVAFLDGRLDDAEERLHSSHLVLCARCRNEVEFQRSLGRVVHELPLQQTSRRFTERTMNTILRASKQSLSYRILQHVGSAAAMVAVLVVLGYILSSPSSLLSGSDDSTPSQLVTTWQTLSTSVNTLLTQSSTLLNKTVGDAVSQQTSTPVSKITAMTLLVLVGFWGLDRFVLQKMIRAKM